MSTESHRHKVIHKLSITVGVRYSHKALRTPTKHKITEYRTCLQTVELITISKNSSILNESSVLPV